MFCKKSLRFLFLSAVLASLTAALPSICLSQEGPLEEKQPSGITPDEIIKRFAAKETEFKQA